MLDGILVIEFLRKLDQRQFFILKIAQRAVEVARLGNHVGIQKNNKLTGRALQSIIHIPALACSCVGRVM